VYGSALHLSTGESGHPHLLLLHMKLHAWCERGGGVMPPQVVQHRMGATIKGVPGLMISGKWLRGILSREMLHNSFSCL
jgi:hypothetical protein